MDPVTEDSLQNIFDKFHISSLRKSAVIKLKVNLSQI